MSRKYFQFGGDTNPYTLEEVDYDPETMFRFRAGTEDYVITVEDLRNLALAGRSIRNPITNLQFTDGEKRDLMVFTRRHLPDQFLTIAGLIGQPWRRPPGDDDVTYAELFFGGPVVAPAGYEPRRQIIDYDRWGEARDAAAEVWYALSDEEQAAQNFYADYLRPMMFRVQQGGRRKRVSRNQTTRRSARGKYY